MRHYRITTISTILLALLFFLPVSHAFETAQGDQLNRLYWQEAERTTEIVDGQLVSSIRARDDASRFNSLPLSAQSYNASFNFNQAGSISAVVNVTASSQAGESSPNARLFAILFNDGQGSAAGDGDIFMSINLSPSGDDGSQLTPIIVFFRCGDADCSSGEDVLIDGTALTPVNHDQPEVAKIAWDGDHTVTFSLGGDTHAVDITTLGLAAARNPDFKFAGVGTTVFGINTRESQGGITALFDNVRVNDALLDDFSGSALDSRWNSQGIRRVLGNGTFSSFLSHIGGNDFLSDIGNVFSARSNNLHVVRPEAVQYLESEVRVNAVTTQGDARARARLTGYWFNDGNVNDGETGEVQAEIRIIQRPDQGFVAEYFTGRCDDPLCNTFTDGAGNRPSAWVPVIGQTHTLSIEQFGSEFEFCFDGLCERVASGFNNAGPSNFRYFKGIGTRIDQANSAADAAMIDAEFDNIRFSRPPTFADVGAGNQFFQDIEKLNASGISAGCGNSNFCGDDLVSRGEMAVFVERGVTGHIFTLPGASGEVFDDVPANHPFAPEIEQFYQDGLTAGCGPSLYCPNATLTREQMAVFLVRLLLGADFQPPAATGEVFNDVPATALFAAWIEVFADLGITAGCGNGNFCPGDAVTRGEMAAFMVRSFDL